MGFNVVVGAVDAFLYPFFCFFAKVVDDLQKVIGTAVLIRI